MVSPRDLQSCLEHASAWWQWGGCEAERLLLGVPEKNPLPGDKRVMKKNDEELHEERFQKNG